MFQLPLQVCRCLGRYRLKTDPVPIERDVSSLEYTVMLAVVLVLGLSTALPLLPDAPSESLTADQNTIRAALRAP